MIISIANLNNSTYICNEIIAVDLCWRVFWL